MPPRKRPRSRSSAVVKPNSLQRGKPVDFTNAVLSEEIILHIFNFLSPVDLTVCSQVNSNWHRLANDEQVRMSFVFLDQDSDCLVAMETTLFGTIPLSMQSSACGQDPVTQRSQTQVEDAV